jgi:hypothetical protein
MARARRGGGSPGLIVLVAVVVLACIAWYLLRPAVQAPAAGVPETALPAAPPSAASADRIDPAQEGKPVTASGKLRVTRPPRDAQLGLSAADALVLERRVDMLQWRETCAEKRCEYALAWSAEPVDSSRFRERGHDNPLRFPFASERFAAAEVHLGAYAVDAAFAAAGVEAVDYPVRAAQLPPNLAATFRERDGQLYAGDDPAHPAVGDLRVAYRIVPAGERSLSGVQIGSRLKPPPAG